LAVTASPAAQARPAIGCRLLWMLLATALSAAVAVQLAADGGCAETTDAGRLNDA